MNKKDYLKTIEKVEKETEEEKTEPQAEKLESLEDFVLSDEYIRLGKDGKIPITVTVRGKETTINIRPLTSQEWSNIRLQSFSSKENIDLLACQIVCTNPDGSKTSSMALNMLDAGVVEILGAAIKEVSGIKDEIDMSEILTGFLKD